MVDPTGLLFVEPQGPLAARPVRDELTLRLAAALAQAREGHERYRGFHVCSCGAVSRCYDLILPGGERTNSLAVHYLAYHHSDLPAEELAKVVAYCEQHQELGEREPLEGQLLGRWR